MPLPEASEHLSVEGTDHYLSQMGQGADCRRAPWENQEATNKSTPISRGFEHLPPVSGVAHLVCFHAAGFPEGSQGYCLGFPGRRMMPGESRLPSQCRLS